MGKQGLRLGGLTQRLAHGRSGATAIEYSLVAALIALTILLSVTSLGDWLDGVFWGIDANLSP